MAPSATEKVVNPTVTKEKDATANAAKNNAEDTGAPKEKAMAPYAVTKPVAAAKATKEVERKAKEARQKSQAAPVPRAAPAPAAPVVSGPRADEESSNEGDSTANVAWDAVHISNIIWHMATTPSKITPEDDVPAEIQNRVSRYMRQWDGYLSQDRKDREQEIFYTQ